MKTRHGTETRTADRKPAAEPTDRRRWLRAEPAAPRRRVVDNARPFGRDK